MLLKLLIPFLLSVSCLFYQGLSFAAGDSPRDFCADMISRSQGQTVTGKLYCSGEKIRMEVEDSVVITRLDKNVSWILMPSEKMYMEHPIDRKSLPKTSREFNGEIERLPLGSENVNGRNTEKYKVTYTEGKGRVVVYQWITDSGFPIKIESLDGSWAVEYKNLSISTQPDSLFELPAGFKKLAMPFSGGSLDGIIPQMQ